MQLNIEIEEEVVAKDYPWVARKNSIPLCKVNQSGKTEPESFSIEKTGFGATI